MLKSGFFHQTNPPGPIRDILEPFLFVGNFHGFIKVFKRLPGVRDTRSHNKCKKQGESKKDSSVSGTPGILNSPASRTPEILDSPVFQICESPVSQMKATAWSFKNSKKTNPQCPGHQRIWTPRRPGHLEVFLVLWWPPNFFCKS